MPINHPTELVSELKCRAQAALHRLEYVRNRDDEQNQLHFSEMTKLLQEANVHRKLQYSPPGGSLDLPHPSIVDSENSGKKVKQKSKSIKKPGIDDDVPMETSPTLKIKIPAYGTGGSASAVLSPTVIPIIAPKLDEEESNSSGSGLFGSSDSSSDNGETEWLKKQKQASAASRAERATMRNKKKASNVRVPKMPSRPKVKREKKKRPRKPANEKASDTKKKPAADSKSAEEKKSAPIPVTKKVKKKKKKILSVRQRLKKRLNIH